MPSTPVVAWVSRSFLYEYETSSSHSGCVSRLRSRRLGPIYIYIYILVAKVVAPSGGSSSLSLTQGEHRPFHGAGSRSLQGMALCNLSLTEALGPLLTARQRNMCGIYCLHSRRTAETAAQQLGKHSRLGESLGRCRRLLAVCEEWFREEEHSGVVSPEEQFAWVATSWNRNLARNSWEPCCAVMPAPPGTSLQHGVE